MINNKHKTIFITLLLSISTLTITGTAINIDKQINLNINQHVNSPLLVSSYLGGEDNDGMYYTGVNIIQDNQGNVFISGTTESTNFPVTSGVYAEEHNGDSDIFITKMNKDLTEILASTYIGGNGNEEARAITIDSHGNIFVSGITESSNFPTTDNAFQSKYGGGTESPYGSGDAFIIKINNDLTDLISSTFLGGKGHETCSCIALDNNEDLIISGSTSSYDFPVSENAFDKTYDSGGYLKDDVFITKLTNDLTEMIASTYISGGQDDFSEGLSVDTTNNIIIAGWTRSPDYPTTEDAYDTTFGYGYYDGFISKLNPDLSNLLSSSFIGGNQWDFCYGLTIDSDDNIFITGHTASRNFPTSTDAYDKTYNGIGGQGTGDDVFISKLSNNLSFLLASTYLGGSDWENGYSLAISDSNLVYVAGSTSSNDFPTVNSFSDTFQGGTTNQGDVFISCFTSDLCQIPASTYLGGGNDENTGYVIIDQDDEIIVAGSTSSNDFPIIGDGFDSSFNGNADVYISKFKTGLTNNIAPDTPEINGPNSGKAGESYEYMVSTNDADDHQVHFFFDWGDGTDSGWIGPYNSGETCTLSHSWDSQGEYEIKVKAKDILYFESDWTTYEISMPKTKMLIDILEQDKTWNSINTIRTSIFTLINDKILQIFNKMIGSSIADISKDKIQNIAHTDTCNVVDQEQIKWGGCGVYSNITAQSFIPTAETLSKVEILIYKFEDADQDVTLTIFDPEKKENLTVVNKSIDQIPLRYDEDWVEIDFPDIKVTPGKEYIIAFVPTGGDFIPGTNKEVIWCYTWDETYDAYPYGDALISDDWERWGLVLYREHGRADFCFKTFTTMENNSAPLTPPQLKIEHMDRLNKEFHVSISTNDPENDDIYYMFDWDEPSAPDRFSSWKGPYKSGENVDHTHISDYLRGTRYLRVKARDIHKAESDWSEPIIFSFPKLDMSNKTPSSLSTIDFEDIDVIPEETYYIVCSHEDSSSMSMWFYADPDYLNSNFDPYENGEAYISINNGRTWATHDHYAYDFCFSTYG